VGTLILTAVGTLMAARSAVALAGVAE